MIKRQLKRGGNLMRRSWMMCRKPKFMACGNAELSVQTKSILDLKMDEKINALHQK